MQIDTETKNRIVVDRLASDFAARLNGAIDFWTAVCLGSMPIDRKDFLREKSVELQSLLGVLANIVGTSFKQHHLDGVLTSMRGQCNQLADAFFVLEQYDLVSEEELQAATATIAECYGELRKGLDAVVSAIGVEPPEGLKLNPDRSAYFANILDGLFDMAVNQRRNGMPVAPPPAVHQT
jgi:hypothetical protein